MKRSMIRLASTITGTLLGATAFAGNDAYVAQRLDPAEVGELSAAIFDSYRLVGGELISLDVDRTPGAALRVILPIEGENIELFLSPKSIRAAGYRLIIQKADGSYEDVPAGPERTLRGVPGGYVNGVVTGMMLDEGLEARIQLANDRVYWLEPVASAIPGVDPSLHVLYTANDVAGGDHRCGVEHDIVQNQVDDSAAHNGHTRGGSGPCVTQLACDADFDYYTDRGSSTTAVQNRITAVINGMNPQYETEVGITYTITTILVRTAEPDPYSSTDAGTLLSQFQNHWNSSQGAIVRDEAELFTGKNMSGSVIGIANLNGICNSQAYNVVEDITPLSCRTDLSAHECGHNWSAQHCDCPGATMNPSLTCSNHFSAVSINQITNYRDTRGCIVCGTPSNPPSMTVTQVAGTGAGLVTADVRVLVDTPDWWTLGGITNQAVGLAGVASGVDIHFDMDPNGMPLFTNVGGGGNPGNAATFVSLPKGQFANARFGAAGAANLAGAYIPTGATPILTNTAINAAYLQFPPSTDGVGVDDAGYVTRVTLDLTGTPWAGQDVVVSTTGAPVGHPDVLGEFLAGAGTRDFPTPLVEITFGFYSTTPPMGCEGDLNNDGVRDLTDLSIQLANFGTPSGADPEDGDLDGDGDVDITDVSIMLSVFGTSCP